MTSTFIPAEVAANVRRRWPERAERWLQQAPEELADVVARYQGSVETVFPARSGLVVGIAAPDGRLVIRTTADPAGPEQAKIAGAFADLDIGPALRETVVNESGTWTVTERLVPGTPVSLEVPDLIEVAGKLFRSMAGQPSPIPEAPHIGDWLQERLVGPEPEDLPPDDYDVSEAERREAAGLLGELRQDQHIELHHGDAHPDNILTGHGGRLNWIDPRGMNGELAYDLAVFALKAAPALSMTTRRLADLLAREIGVAADRVHAWLAIARAARV